MLDTKNNLNQCIKINTDNSRIASPWSYFACKQTLNHRIKPNENNNLCNNPTNLYPSLFGLATPIFRLAPHLYSRNTIPNALTYKERNLLKKNCYGLPRPCCTALLQPVSWKMGYKTWLFPKFHFIFHFSAIIRHLEMNEANI
jgi:hypothetical protein